MAIACCDLVRCAVTGLWRRWTSLSQTSDGGREPAFWLWSPGIVWRLLNTQISTMMDYLRSQTELTTMIGMKPPAGPGDRAHPRHSLKECEGLVNKAKAQLLENGALPEQSTYSDVLLCVCS